MNFPTLQKPNLVNFYAVEIKDMTIQMIIGKDNRDKDDIEKINKIDVSDIYINNATIPISKHRRKQLKARLIEVLGDKLC